MVIFDASALLAIILDEPGAELALQYLDTAIMSTVNVVEVVTSLINRGTPPDKAALTFAAFQIETVALTETLATEAGRLRAETIDKGLSLGDRVCLALARSRSLPAYTSDRAWADLDIGAEIILIR